MKNCLTIAGSDSGGGAGIQADLRSFASLGIHGCSVITCITAQNTQRVESIFRLPLEVIDAQLQAITHDFSLGAIKTGMLYDAKVVRLVADRIPRAKLVVDPVMVATTGASLAMEDFVEAMRDVLLPRTTLVTPNLLEASRLTGLRVKSLKDMRRACVPLHDLGCKYVLIKGGHLAQPTDVLWDGERYQLYKGEKVMKGTHGSGCTYSALIAGYLALGLEMTKAIAQAKDMVTKAIRFGYNPGKGVGVVNQTFPVVNAMAMGEVMRKLSNALSTLSVPLPLFPEVGINFVYALPYPSSIQDVLGVRGRIRLVGKEIKRGCLEFGGSKHVATIVLTAMRFNPEIRSVINMRYSREVVETCQRLGFLVGSFDRREEPTGKSTMEWGTATAIQSCGRVPDVIYDEGGIGKEPMVRVLGTDPEDVVKKLVKIVLGSKKVP